MRRVKKWAWVLTYKTVTMVISKKQETPTCNIRLKNSTLKQVNSFQYLGANISSDGRCIHEIKIRIAQAKKAFMDLARILTNRRLSIDIRKRVLNCYIIPILTYGSEAWTINNAAASIINAAEMWFLRRMMKISYTERIRNEEVLRRAGTKRILCTKVRQRQARFFGHVMRREGMEHLVTTGKINGKRSRGRQREKHLNGLQKWMHIYIYIYIYI